MEEVNYDKDILPFRDNDPEAEVFDCFLCHEPVIETERLFIKVDEGMQEVIHPACLRIYDPWQAWIAKVR